MNADGVPDHTRVDLDGTVTTGAVVADTLPLSGRTDLSPLGHYNRTVVANRASVGVNVIATSDSPARGNENDLHEPDGTDYPGVGPADGYAPVNLGSRYALNSNLPMPWA